MVKSKPVTRSIVLDGTEYAYRLRRSLRSARLRLVISADGELRVSAPIFVTIGFIERFLRERTEWIESRLQFFRSQPKALLARGGKREYEKHKEAARKLAHERLAYWNQFYRFSYDRISIRNQKTRWGSCSKQGNLSFNYRIALLPIALADYVILHELCHLGAFDHSDRFWRLMERAMPDYLKRRRALRDAASL
ncbi:MAG: M48 family metallopeptidase [Undibacterium sp.]